MALNWELKLFQITLNEGTHKCLYPHLGYFLSFRGVLGRCEGTLFKLLYPGNHTTSYICIYTHYGTLSSFPATHTLAVLGSLGSGSVPAYSKEKSTSHGDFPKSPYELFSNYGSLWGVDYITAPNI